MADVKKTDEILAGKVSADAIDEEMRQLELEEKRLSLIVLRETVEASRSKQFMLRQAIERQIATIKANKGRREAEQNACSHKKGGRGAESILNGNAAEYSIAVQTEPWGETYCICMRCLKEWRRPLAVLMLTNQNAFLAAKKKDPRGYKAALMAYEQAIRMTTDNTPSGSTLFRFTREEEDDAA